MMAPHSAQSAGFGSQHRLAPSPPGNAGPKQRMGEDMGEFYIALVVQQMHMGTPSDAHGEGFPPFFKWAPSSVPVPVFHLQKLHFPSSPIRLCSIARPPSGVCRHESSVHFALQSFRQHMLIMLGVWQTVTAPRPSPATIGAFSSLHHTHPLGAGPVSSRVGWHPFEWQQVRVR